MRQVSSEYKEIMNRKIRNRAYVSVGLGIVNQDAQKDAKVTSNLAEWCNPNLIFDSESNTVIYATMEQDYFKTDGSMIFLPEEYLQVMTNGAITDELLGSVRIDFGDIYSIKGLTINFGECYPTEFTIQSAEKTITYINSVANFSTTDVIGETDYIIITPTSMIGGQQRLRIYSIVMGVGLNFSNAEIQDISITDSASSISDEIPVENATLNIFDKENRFNVDDSNSFIQFLESMQKVTLSFGIDLDNGEKEWLKYATLYLMDWDSKKGMLNINAVDRLSTLEDEYSLGNKIYERTAYDEGVSILTDAGLEPDEYAIDDYLQDIALVNPMPIATHRECLQLLANACRCAIHQDTDGRIILRGNFANVIEPEDLTVETNGVVAWSNPQNILYGTEYVYADLSKNFMTTDGAMYFMPEDSSYLSTAYVSEQTSDLNGVFETNPILSIVLPATYTYYGIRVKFDGNPPKEMLVHTYKDDELQQSITFTDLEKESVLYHEYSNFDKITLEFVKTEPYNHILVNEVAFGDLTDYVLTKDLMMEEPHGFMEEKIKSVSVKIFSFENDENGEPKEVEDNVFVKKTIGVAGKNKVCHNQLVSTEAHATLLAEWLGNYYANNVSYDVSYRGEPRLNASDIIKMESDVINNLQVEIVNHNLNFNGTFSGTLELRKALRMVE